MKILTLAWFASIVALVNLGASDLAVVLVAIPGVILLVVLSVLVDVWHLLDSRARADLEGVQ